jgi:hypothetical protein
VSLNAESGITAKYFAIKNKDKNGFTTGGSVSTASFSWVAIGN